MPTFFGSKWVSLPAARIRRVVLEPFGQLDAAVKRALKEEAERLETFVV